MISLEIKKIVISEMVIMKVKIKAISDYYDPKFTASFREYFKELGISLKEDSDVFDEITKSALDEGTKTLVCLKSNSIIGFVMYQEDIMKSKTAFFSERFVFLREVYIQKEYRNKGIGTELLTKVFLYCKEIGVSKILLTTKSAFEFYSNQGFYIDSSITAINNMQVMVKDIN